MFRILEALVRWLAPVLSFTAEEIWPLIPGERGESVMFETWYGGLEALQGSAQQRIFWEDIKRIRRDVSGQLEVMRQDKKIGGSLDAEVNLLLPTELLDQYGPLAGELRFFFLTSECRLLDQFLTAADAAAAGRDVVNVARVGEDTITQVEILASEHKKCIRCWHHRPDVGSVPEHPEICGRCLQNLPGGAGEVRRYF
jgi:isoleucyl-tRNA synthetase